ncbi:MAG: hypothetical protein IJN28_01090 [Selenomonadales bacterium]|nr:hypothetical protein [Selenomonadales bacterium]
MMMRLLLTICLMIGFAMPCAAADAWSEKEINEWKESVTKPFEAYKEKHLALIQSGNEVARFSLPLYKLTIESDEWMEGDTYHIRYTFTNPTDELIEEAVLRTNVLLYTHDGTPYSSAITKRDPAPEWVLRIEPHSSTTHTITLPKEPAFTHFTHEETRFYLSDGSTLSYFFSLPSIIDITPVDIDFRVEPTALNKGILTLTITNRSFETLHTLRNIRLYTQTGKYSSHNETVPLPSPIPLDLEPNETKTLQIPVPLNDHLSPDSACAHYPDLDIDDLRYMYDRDKKSFTQWVKQKHYQYLPTVHHAKLPDVLIFGNMEPIKNGIVYYLTFYNNTDHPQKIAYLSMTSDYEDMFFTQKKISWSLYLKNDPIRLYPGQIKRYAFALPIVADTTETALASTTIFEAKGWSRAFDRHPSISAEPLHAMQKVVYKPLRFSKLYPNISYPYSLPHKY